MMLWQQNTVCPAVWPVQTSKARVKSSIRNRVPIVSEKNVAVISADSIPAIAPLFRLQFEKVQDSWVLLYPEGMVKLNATAAEILNRCDGRLTVNDIVTELENVCQQTGLAPDIIDFLSDAIKQQWIILK
jgi:pyrroloquinoline quinone biosynthesis protein D